MRKQVLSLLFGILIITSFIIISMPNAVGDHDTKNKEVKIVSGKTYTLKIDISEGEVKYKWKIVNHTNENISFFLIDDNNKDIVSITGNISKFENKTNLDSGKYFFTWRNYPNQTDIDLIYNITFQVTGEGCYSTDIILSVSLITIIFFSIGINKKKK